MTRFFSVSCAGLDGNGEFDVDPKEVPIFHMYQSQQEMVSIDLSAAVLRLPRHVRR